MGGKSPTTISGRNHKAAKDSETLLWRAMCDSMEDAKEYVADDCIMLNPLISADVLSTDDGATSVHEAFDRAAPFRAYRIEPGYKTVEIDMMSVQMVYRATITDARGRDFAASCSGTWRQTAGGDWFLCAMMVAPEKTSLEKTGA